MLNKYYRMSILWLRNHNILHMSIEDYAKITKKSHELIRRMGVDWDGKTLCDDERVGKQYL